MLTQAVNVSLPLYVDLDGTLLKSDLLWEMVLLEIVTTPQAVIPLLRAAMAGRAALKRHLALRVPLDPGLLPYNEAFVTWLEWQRESGRRLILATASDEIIARRIAQHLGIFDDVIASDGSSNVKGPEKLARILARDQQFEYAGNSHADVVIWEQSRGAVPVCAPPHILSALRRSTKVRVEFPRTPRTLRLWSRLIRSHQWSKNLLVFLPLLTSHRLLEWTSLAPAVGMFLSLNLTASATYILNDLHDLASDRQHHTKRRRALASGEVSIAEGVVLAGILGLAGIAIASATGLAALTMLLAYVVSSLAYSLALKKRLLLDVFTLSGLYTLRIIAGSAVTGIVLSGWLLSFSVFLFLSLGFSKRAAEIRAARQSARSHLAGRAYRRSDFLQINQFGVSSGYVSSLVLALYVGSEQVTTLYSQPAWLWFLVPLFLFWISRLWLLAYRGKLNEDPVVFALTDRTTVVLAGICFVFGFLATSGVALGFVK